MPASTVELNASDRFRKLLRDPVLLISLIILWSLLSLFILVPLIWLFMRTFEEGGRFTLANIISILADPNQRQALWNSLLLGSLVGLSVEQSSAFSSPSQLSVPIFQRPGFFSSIAQSFFRSSPLLSPRPSP